MLFSEKESIWFSMCHWIMQKKISLKNFLSGNCEGVWQKWVLNTINGAWMSCSVLIPTGLNAILPPITVKLFYMMMLHHSCGHFWVKKWHASGQTRTDDHQCWNSEGYVSGMQCYHIVSFYYSIILLECIILHSTTKDSDFLKNGSQQSARCLRKFTPIILGMSHHVWMDWHFI